jgi:hypothetical protein
LCFQRALRELISATDAIYAKQFEEFFVGLEGRFVAILVDSLLEFDFIVLVVFIYHHVQLILHILEKLFVLKAL